MLSSLKSSKYAPLFLVAFLAISAVVIATQAGPFLIKRQAATETKTGPGWFSSVDPSQYGVSPEDEVSESPSLMTMVAEGTGVQNLQPPTISGFSSDLFTGGSTVSYPLALPSGRGGLTPSLALNYSSSSVYGSVMGADVNSDGDHKMEDIKGPDQENWYDQLLVQSSQVGLGWNLSGLGYVFRGANNRYTLVLNGQSYRLFKTLEEDGEWDWETGKWHTDPTGFLKIRHSIAGKIDGDEPWPNEPAPENFEVTDTNGTIYTFEPKGYFWKPRPSLNDYTKLYNKWVLTKVEDVHNNQIAITYDVEEQIYDAAGNVPYPRAIYPSEIRYSGGILNEETDANDFTAKIDFVFGPRDDWENLRYAPHNDNAGSNQFFFSKNRIEKINVKVKNGADWKIVRQYELDNDQYFESAGDIDCDGPVSSEGFCLLHPKLTKITARGRDDTGGDDLGDSALPAYTFEYYNNSNDYNTYRLLSSADNGYKGKVEYVYQAYEIDDYNPKNGTSHKKVFGAHRVTKKTAYDGQNNSFKTTYDYPEHTVGISDDRYHSGFESVGHNLITENVFNKNGGSKIRETKYYFIQGESGEGEFYVSPERGRLWKSETSDGLGSLLASSETDYLRETIPSDAPQNTQRDIWETPHFIAAKETRACAEPNSAYPLGSKATFEYNIADQGGQQWGNLTNTLQYEVTGCDFANASPYRSTHNTYSPNLDMHITNRMTETETIAYPEDERLTLGWNSYNDKGLLTLSRAFYNFPDSADTDPSLGAYDTIDSTFGYDSFGNLTTTTTYEDYGNSSLATAGSGTARTSRITHDDTYHTFPVSATNPLLHKTKTEYRYTTETIEKVVKHPSLANKIITENPNKIRTISLVDNLGRPAKSYLPGDTTGNDPAVIIEYNDDEVANGDLFRVHTQTRDDKNDGSGATYHHSWQFYNGLGQMIESQSEVEGDGAKIVVAASEFNALGQAIKTLVPFESFDGGTLKFASSPDWTKTHSEADYDSLGRVEEARTPTETGEADDWYTAQSGYYGRKTAVLDPKNHLAISEIDNLGRAVETQIFEGAQSLPAPSGSASVKASSRNLFGTLKQVFNRAIGRPDLSTPNLNTAPNLPTKYYIKTKLDYDSLDRVIKTTTTDLNDTVSAISEVTYNQFGQKTSSTDPDLGRWGYTYYPTGTLKTITDAKNQVTTFRYDILNRIIYKYYGDVGQQGLVASFVYDCHRNGNGRLCFDQTFDPLVFTATSTGGYNYDEQGRLASEDKTIDGATYTTSFAYDAAGRQRTVTYPDSTSETVTYSYNDVSLLNNVSGIETYLAEANYNVLGMLKNETLGNNVVNTFNYEPFTYRLASKAVGRFDGFDQATNAFITNPLWKQSLAEYDAVGNILHIQYPVTATNPAEFINTYIYDGLNRLTEMTSTDEVLSPSANYVYDQLGRMEFKSEEIPTPTPTIIGQ